MFDNDRNPALPRIARQQAGRRAGGSHAAWRGFASDPPARPSAALQVLRQLFRQTPLYLFVSGLKAALAARKR